MTLNRARAAVTVAFITNGFVVGSFFSRVPDFKAKFQVTSGEFAIALALDALGVIVSIGPAGRICAKYGSRTVAVPSAIGLSLSLFLTGLTQNFQQFCIALFFVGALLATQDVGMNAHAIAVEHEYKAKFMGTFHAFFSVGGFAGAFIGGIFSQARVSPAVHTLIVGLVATILGITFIRWWLPSTIDIHEIEHHKRRRKRPAIFWILGAIAFCAQIGEGAAGDWGGILTRETFNASPFVSTLPYVFFSITMITGRLLGDRLTTRFRSRSVLIVAGSIAGGGLMAGILIGGTPLIIMGWALLGAGLSVVIPVIFSSGGEIAKNKFANQISPAEGVAMVAGVAYAGFMAGPPTIGFLANHIGLRWAMLLPALLALLFAYLASRVFE